MAKKEEIILGSGDLYYAEFDGATIPEDSTLEVEEKRAGHIKGGASIEYKVVVVINLVAGITVVIYIVRLRNVIAVVI